MIFELMSDGKIARLPDSSLYGGIPSYLLPKVMLFMPYNRVLVGSSVGDSMECWYYGRIGTDSWKEVFLYEGESLVMKERNIPDIEVPPSAVRSLRIHLLEQLRPPGSHISTLMVLRNIRKSLYIFDEGNQWTNEKWVISRIWTDMPLRQAYWGIRKALVKKNIPMLDRIKLWYSLASDIYPENPENARIWFSIMELPGEQDLNRIESLGFSRENLLNMNSNFSNPVVLSNAQGYLVLQTQYSGEDFSELRIWVYLPVSAWEELRRNRRMSIREIVQACWGYTDALEADMEMGRYGNLDRNPGKMYERGSKV